MGINTSMKTHATVSSQRRKGRKAHFSAPSNIRRKIMSCALSKELRAKYKCRSLPVRKGDTVLVKVGDKSKGAKGKEGKVKSGYRKKYCIKIEKVTRTKTDQATEVDIPVHPLNCEITKLSIDKSRKILLARKDRDNKVGSGADKMD